MLDKIFPYPSCATTQRLSCRRSCILDDLVSQAMIGNPLLDSALEDASAVAQLSDGEADQISNINGMDTTGSRTGRGDGGGVAQPLKVLSKKKVASYNKSLAKRGVVYLSRVPPFMKPAKVKHLMEQHGVVTRVYLVEEDQASRRARKKSGGNSGKRFTEGWVEFEDKKVARAIAESLNNTLIGGRKRNYYHDDMWNLKYLKKFKWDHLTEKVAYERRVRSQKLRLETMQAKRENAKYVELVESGRSFAKMDERKRKRSQEQAGGSGAVGAADNGAEGTGGRGPVGNGETSHAPDVGDAHRRIRRRFKQSKPVADVGGGGGEKGGVDRTVLQSVFGGNREKRT